ncbi:hypothetical protein JDV02_001479 [Purpureocillium takamizusanense]|uniref:Methyl-CpG-binding domain-containing protein 4 n=1 Tax=Purpureocillium takamizusanense TaxID=2060973 RepID=A0A9Q8V7I9_9HYPO|nr:uncharacterized protein JDV02_001479 [Purpureocillium takamizusanense]UNI14899.1 hypothetical protein JDV02_001479 [Purpureocillium takamizusanense]
MTASLGHTALCAFDVWDDARDFLAAVFDHGTCPKEERQRLLDLSLLAGAQDWQASVECASTICSRHPHDPTSLQGSDTLTYLPFAVFEAPEVGLSQHKPWHETDRLIACAKALESQPYIRPPPSPRASSAEQRHIRRSKKQPPKPGHTSHYWLESDTPQLCPNSAHTHTARDHGRTTSEWKRPRNVAQAREVQPNNLGGGQNLNCWDTRDLVYGISTDGWSAQAITGQHGKLVSPYFAAQGQGPSKRPLAGKVSCVPFPPLTAMAFGIVQERVAHEPFWLLIAVTFLIKTSGQLAIPAFYKVKERFPTPLQLANPANGEELGVMIRHLGLSAVRVGYIQKYARTFLDNPPRPGVRYKVRNYDRRDVGRAFEGTEKPPQWQSTSRPPPDAGVDDADAWEIGHMTQGKYAIDSWRIFCRDAMLGRAEDWNGSGREPEFQPEWMRVMPQDKELRAFLRWMWMREGWEWDPVTGDRTVLSEEVRVAVDQGRVEYDETGGLRILEEPRGI